MTTARSQSILKCGLTGIPIEVQGEIFMKACAVDFHDLPERLITTSLVLGAVCRAWREIAWSTPRLWSVIVLRISPDSERYSSQLELLDLWLTNSRGLPLSIHFETADSQMAYKPPMLALTKLVEQCERWECLDICIFDDVDSAFINMLRSVKGRVPLLQRAYFRHPDNATFDVSFVRMDMLETAPRLRDFSITFLYLTSFILPWTQLTSFRSKIQDMYECSNVLSQCPNLQRCHFTAAHWACSTAEYNSYHTLTSRTVMSHLTSLNITNAGDNTISYLLDYITCPVLHELHVDSIPIKGSILERPVNLPWAIIEDFFKRSQCPLDILSMGSDVFGNSVFPILQKLPTLKKLTLMEDMSPKIARGDEFLPSLVANLSSACFLPQLTHLYFLGHALVNAKEQILHILDTLRARLDTSILGKSRLEVLSFKVDFSSSDIDDIWADDTSLENYKDALQNETCIISITTISGVDLLNIHR